LYVFFWLITRRLKFIRLPAYEDGTVCSETSAYKLQTPGNYPEESIQQWEHGESLKSRSILVTQLIGKTTTTRGAMDTCPCPTFHWPTFFDPTGIGFAHLGMLQSDITPELTARTTTLQASFGQYVAAAHFTLRPLLRHCRGLTQSQLEHTL
jgi:hypothetical protein